MPRQENNPPSTMNNQGNMGVKKFPENKFKDMRDCDVNDRELKIAVLKKQAIRKLRKAVQRAEKINFVHNKKKNSQGSQKKGILYFKTPIKAFY